MKDIEKLQNLLPLGYLYLVILGILKESVFFYQLGVSILKYSTIMDILISPIADITSEPVILFSIIFIVFFTYVYVQFLAKNQDKTWIKKLTFFKALFTENEATTPEQLKKNIDNQMRITIITGITGFFLFGGWGQGNRLREQIINDKLNYNTQIHFNTGQIEQVYLIESNSSYYFFVAKGSKDIQIAPIDAVNKLQFTYNKKLKPNR